MIRNVVQGLQDAVANGDVVFNRANSRQAIEIRERC